MLPAVPPVPKAPGTLLPAFDSSSSTSRLDPVDETPSSEHSNLPPERPELVLFLVFLPKLVVVFVFRAVFCCIVLRISCLLHLVFL